jgi:chemotaxis protein MotB
MAGKGKKRGHSGEHENHERWLLTYADMITLLVAFFIMLYAMSVMNITKFQQLAVSVRSGFGGSMINGSASILHTGGGMTGKPSIVSNGQNKNHDSQNNSSDPSGADVSFPVPSRAFAARQEGKRLSDVYKILKKYIKTKGLESKVMIVNSERGIVITLLTDKMLFDSGEADLRPEEMPLLNTISDVLRTKIDNPIHIEGHTDNLPIHTERYPSNWELSVIRATNVLRYLESQKVPADRLEASGYADQRPVVPNTDDDARRRNRRVEIVIVPRYSTAAANTTLDHML